MTKAHAGERPASRAFSYSKRGSARRVTGEYRYKDITSVISIQESFSE